MIVAVGLVPIYWVGMYNYEFILVVSNVLFPLFAGVAAAVCFKAAKKYRWKGKLANVITGFFIASLFWFLAELTWTIYVFIFGIEVPYPSLVDVFYVAGYVACYIAFAFYLNFFREVLNRRIGGVIVGVAAAFTAIVALTLLGPMATSEVKILEKTLNLTYPVLDIALFAASLAGVFVFLKGRLSVVWMLISATFLMDSMADILFSYIDFTGMYYEGHPVELPFLWAYLLFILALWIHLKEL